MRPALKLFPLVSCAAHGRDQKEKRTVLSWMIHDRREMVLERSFGFVEKGQMPLKRADIGW